MSRLCFVAWMAGAWLGPGFAAGTALSAAQSQPATTQPPKGFKTVSDPAGRFSLFYPEKWRLVAGARDLLLTITERDLKAIVVVEQRQLLNPITEITNNLMTLEVGDLKSRQPDAQGIAPSIAKGRPTVMVVDYSRAGISGPERLRQYSVYEGTVLLRVTCIALTKEFDKHIASFEAIANSVKIAARKAGGDVVEQR